MVFIDEIALQAKIAKRAADGLIETHDTFDKVDVWCSIQSILVTEDNVSKILWPSSKKYKQRGERLRQILKKQKIWSGLSFFLALTDQTY